MLLSEPTVISGVSSWIGVYAVSTLEKSLLTKEASDDVAFALMNQCVPSVKPGITIELLADITTIALLNSSLLAISTLYVSASSISSKSTCTAVLESTVVSIVGVANLV